MLVNCESLINGKPASGFRHAAPPRSPLLSRAFVVMERQHIRRGG
jgi:hypothetical protein